MKKVYVLLLSCILLFLAGCATKIDLTSYVDVDFEGYDGEGTATFEIDYEELITDYEEIFGFDKRDLEKKSGQRFLEDVMDAISGELSDDEKLENGDEIVFSWDVDADDLEEEYKIKFVYEDVTVKVKRLDDPDEVIGVGTYPTPTVSAGWPEPTEAPNYVEESPLAGIYDITVWAPDSYGISDLMYDQIQRFCDENPGIEIIANVEPISESEAATYMVNYGTYDGADLFCFAQDQLQRLVYADVLSPLEYTSAERVKTSNDAGAVKAASLDNMVWAYPIASDNGYFMYYDKNVIPEYHLDSLEDILADCEAADRTFHMELETSGWYNVSFMFATGCISEWFSDTYGEVIGVNDTFYSEAGLAGLKGMQKVLKSPAHMNSSSFSEGNPAVVISGTWSEWEAISYFGADCGATDLPSFTVDGTSYHMASFSGNRLMGVKPQTDKTREIVLHKLAQYLTGPECQHERAEEWGLVPSNLAVQNSAIIQDNEVWAALAAQNAYSVPQENIHWSWWDISKEYATAAKYATTDAELWQALQSYADVIYNLFAN